MKESGKEVIKNYGKEMMERPLIGREPFHFSFTIK
jgi:hypothetical protein